MINIISTMAEAQIEFRREGLEGVIPVGSYLGDAIRRFGIRDYERCSAEHDCVITVERGEESLSPMTAAEQEFFAGRDRGKGDRLACHARIEKPGEIVVMTKEKKEATREEPDETTGEQYRKVFAELPLEQKIGELMKLEAIAFGETFSYILNSPFMVFEKVGDVMANFGMKLESKAREAQRPPEHTKPDEAAETSETKKTARTRKNSERG